MSVVNNFFFSVCLPCWVLQGSSFWFRNFAFSKCACLDLAVSVTYLIYLGQSTEQCSCLLCCYHFHLELPCGHLGDISSLSTIMPVFFRTWLSSWICPAIRMFWPAPMVPPMSLLCLWSCQTFTQLILLPCFIAQRPILGTLAAASSCWIPCRHGLSSSLPQYY